MNGMEMLLESFGFDAEQIKVDAQSAMELVRNMNEQLVAMKERLDSVDSKLHDHSGCLKMIQSKLIDIESQILVDDATWPPGVTQPYVSLENQVKELQNDGRREGAESTTK